MYVLAHFVSIFPFFIFFLSFRLPILFLLSFVFYALLAVGLMFWPRELPKFEAYEFGSQCHIRGVVRPCFHGRQEATDSRHTQRSDTDVTFTRRHTGNSICTECGHPSLWTYNTTCLDQCFSTPVRPRSSKFFFSQDEGPVPTNLLVNTFLFFF